jgi:MFS family permease
MVPVAAMGGLAPAMAFPLLGPIAEQHHVSPATATWALTSAFLAAAVSTPLLGRFSDLYGYRRVLVVALAITLAGSVVIATTPNFAVLILGRTLQGVAAPLYPIAIAVLQRELGGRQLRRSISNVTLVLAVGGGVAIVAAGIAGTGSDYRTVFWLPVLVCVVAIVAVLVGTRTEEPDARGRVDVLGAVLLSASLVLVLLPLSRAAA